MGRGEKPRAASVMGLVSENSFEAYGQLFLFRPLPVFKPFFKRCCTDHALFNHVPLECPSPAPHSCPD